MIHVLVILLLLTVLELYFRWYKIYRDKNSTEAPGTPTKWKSETDKLIRAADTVAYKIYICAEFNLKDVKEFYLVRSWTLQQPIAFSLAVDK